jgi:hypothetical protein
MCYLLTGLNDEKKKGQKRVASIPSTDGVPMCVL